MPASKTLKIKIKDKGDLITFSSPDELRRWASEEYQAWQWVYTAENPYRHQHARNFQTFQTQLEQWAHQWKSHADSSEFLKQNTPTIQNIFDQFVGETVLIRGSPAGGFVEELRESEGDQVAIGAYGFLTATPSGQNFPRPEIFEGFVQAFLYKHEVKWTGGQYRKDLEKLQKQYSEQISDHDSRFSKIEKRSGTLESELTEKREALQTLHVDQEEAFKALIVTYDQQLKNIEQTYDQKLALQKPVTYWETKEKHHAQASKRFAWASGVVATCLIGLLVALIHWLFGDLQPGQDPRYWEIGVLATATFFSIWVVRILLRLFFSNIHLASDAAERRTMVLTYLALAREGSDVGPEEKKLILQHLFRAASDGLVKDEAAPPSFIEYFTRR